MKRSTKIIQIAGLRGILMVLFIGVCLAAGFIVFPARVAMHIWNTYIVSGLALPAINIWQGLLLWAGVAVTVYIANGGTSLVSFHEPAELNEEEMRILMDRIKIHAKARKLNSMIMRADELKKIQSDDSVDEPVEISQIPEEINDKKS